MADDWEDIVFGRPQTQTAPAPAAPRNGGTVTHIDDARTRAYISAALDRETAELAAMGPRSGRNARLNIVALKLGQLPADRDTVRARLIEACSANGLLAEDGESQCQATIDSGFAKADREGVRPIPDPPAAPEAIPGATTIDPGADGADGGGESTAFRFVDGASFVLDIPEEIPALWGDGEDVLWAEGESLMIAGPMGLGKTTLAGQLIRAQLGIGEPQMLGMAVKPRGRILYLAMDRPAQIARAMARQFGADNRDILAEKLVIWKGPPPADIAKNPLLLAKLAALAGADTVYIDSLKDAAIGLSEDEVGAGYNRARQHALAEGCQLCELHHTVKRGVGGGAPNHVADVYGSAWLTNGTGSIILLGGEPGDPIVSFRHPRQPAAEVGPFTLLHDQTAGTITVHHATSLIDMAAHCGPEGLTAKGAAAALFDTDRPSRGQIEKARRRLDGLTADGLITACDGPRANGGKPTTVWFPAGGAA